MISIQIFAGRNSGMEMEEHMSKENVLVYGMGNFYLQNEKSLNGLYHIRAFIDKKGAGGVETEKSYK